MAKVYKVWIQIEEVDEEKDHHENVTEPMCVGQYNSQKQAGKLLQVLIDKAFEWNEQIMDGVFENIAQVLEITEPGAQGAESQNKG